MGERRFFEWNVTRPKGRGFFAMSNDHRLDIYIDAITYLALKARAAEMDRNISQHVRHLIRHDLIKASAEEQESGRGNGAGNEGEE